MMGGSWIMFSDKGWVVCLLNGAFVNHRHQPPYRMSRGVIIKQLFEQPTAADFIEQVDLFNIEPFTTIISDDHKLYEFRWDGMIKHINILDRNQTHIWSSCTLYTPEMQVTREAHFRSLLSHHQAINSTDIRNIHLTGDIQDPGNNFVMNRENRVKTISHSLLTRTGDTITFDFMNLENGTQEYLEVVT